MLFFNVFLLSAVGLAAASGDVEVVKAKRQLDAREILLNAAQDGLFSSRDGSNLVFDNRQGGAVLVGREFGGNGNAVRFVDARERVANPNTIQLINARQPQAFSGRFVHETEGIAVERKNFEDERPKPYAFSYDTTDEFNTRMARQEQQDESGRVTGFYSYIDANGITRRVDYVADEDGFRADVKTNEPGTKSSLLGSAIIQSAAPEVVPQEVAIAAPAKRVVAPVVVENTEAAQLRKLQLEKTPVIVRSLDNNNIQLLNVDNQGKIQLLNAQPNSQQANSADLQSVNPNFLNLARQNGFSINQNLMRYAMPSISQSFGPASLVKIADPTVGARFLKAAVAAAAARA